VRAAASLLADSVERYVFVSSMSVYADYSQPTPEEAPLEQPAANHPTHELLPDYANYGPLKALAEQALEERFPGRGLIVRPGLIVGPHDPTDRFTYWARRPERGGTILAPAPPDSGVQMIDVRDLARWMVDMVERGETGVFNATSPPGAHTFGSMLDACGARDVAWAGEAWLLAEGVQPWSDLPVWIPTSDPDMRWFHRADVTRAVEAGLTFRPLAETARDAPEWTGKAGLAPERASQLLAAWRKEAA
jgi:2'-hydroxyisoflavone reductase